MEGVYCIHGALQGGRGVLYTWSSLEWKGCIVYMELFRVEGVYCIHGALQGGRGPARCLLGFFGSIFIMISKCDFVYIYIQNTMHIILDIGSLGISMLMKFKTNCKSSSHKASFGRFYSLSLGAALSQIIFMMMIHAKYTTVNISLRKHFKIFQQFQIENIYSLNVVI